MIIQELQEIIADHENRLLELERVINQHADSLDDLREQPQEQIIVHRHSDMGKEEFNLLQQVSLKVDRVERTFKEHLTPKKRYTTYEV